MTLWLNGPDFSGLDWDEAGCGRSFGQGLPSRLATVQALTRLRRVAM
jgi:hypothetical protein